MKKHAEDGVEEPVEETEMCEGCGKHAPTEHLQGWNLCDACQKDALAVRVGALETHIKTLSDRHTRLVERSWSSSPGGNTEVLAFRLQLLEQRVQHLQEFVANVSEHCNLVGDAFTMREWAAFPSVEDYLELEEHIRGAL